MEKYTFSSPCPQNFSLSYSMMKYIRQNWSPTIYQKLTLSCKQFFASHRMLVVTNASILSWKRVFYWRFGDDDCLFDNGKSISLKNNKVWITGSMDIHQRSERIPAFCKLVFKFTLTSIMLKDVDIIFEDFLTLTNQVKELGIIGCTILNDQKKPLNLGDIMVVIPTVKNLCYGDQKQVEFRQSFTLTLPRLSNLTDLSISATAINCDDFCKFIKIHSRIKIELYISVSANRESIIKTLKEAFPFGTVKSTDYKEFRRWSLNFEETEMNVYH